MQICENGDILRMRITCSVYRFLCRHIVFLHKVTLPTTGLAYIIQHFFDVFADMSEQNCFHNFAVCTQNFSKTQKDTFSIFSTSLSCKHP